MDGSLCVPRMDVCVYFPWAVILSKRTKGSRAVFFGLVVLCNNAFILRDRVHDGTTRCIVEKKKCPKDMIILDPISESDTTHRRNRSLTREQRRWSLMSFRSRTGRSRLQSTILCGMTSFHNKCLNAACTCLVAHGTAFLHARTKCAMHRMETKAQTHIGKTSPFDSCFVSKCRNNADLDTNAAAAPSLRAVLPTRHHPCVCSFIQKSSDKIMWWSRPENYTHYFTSTKPAKSVTCGSNDWIRCFNACLWMMVR